MIKEKQKLPKWFNGELYEKGATVQNRFSGEEYKLNAMELSMYDFVMGSTILVEMGKSKEFWVGYGTIQVISDGPDGYRSFKTHQENPLEYAKNRKEYKSGEYELIIK